MKVVGNNFIKQTDPRHEFSKITDITLNFSEFYTSAPKVIELGQNALRTFQIYIKKKSIRTLKLSWFTSKPIRKTNVRSRPVNRDIIMGNCVC